MSTQPKHLAHLLNILRLGIDSPSLKYAFFLGAGASVSSGVPLASAMEVHFKQRLFEAQSEYTDLDGFIAARPWDKGDNCSDYATLFGMVYDQPAQRQHYIQTLMKGAVPNWGYLYLVSLMEAGFVNTVVTTNFDSLVEEACHRHSRTVRPLVHAHELSIRNLKLTPSRAKIVKLHGDFLFENLKNTTEETAELESSTIEKLRQLSHETGLVVVGYSGRDRSVMRAFDKILTDGGFGHGVYWCNLRDEVASAEVLALTKHRAFHLIEIDGFDDMMSRVHGAMGCKLPSDMFDPSAILDNRYQGLISSPVIESQSGNSIDSPGSIIAWDMSRLIKCVEKVASIPSTGDESSLVSPGTLGEVLPSASVSNELLSDIAERKGNLPSALRYSKMDFVVRRNPKMLAKAFELAARLGLPEQSDLLEMARSLNTGEIEWSEHLTECLLASLNAGWYEYARELSMMEQLNGGQLNKIELLNRIQIKRHRAEPLEDGDMMVLEQIAQGAELLPKMAAMILLQQYESAMNLALVAVRLQSLKPKDLTWPIFRLLEGKLPGHEFAKILSHAGPSQLYPFQPKGDGLINVVRRAPSVK